MSSMEIKRKKQDLGIFYTDQRIADFVFEILKIWKEKEEKEYGRWESRKHFPSVVDPAVGEGVFLKTALEQKFTTPKYVFGIDIDEDVKKKWVEINLLKSFGSRAELDNHFYHQNGLLQLDENKVFRHKKGGLKEFDVVVGNPPYGGVGLGETKLTDNLIVQLAKFEVLPENVKINLITANSQSDLFNSDKQLAIKPNAKQRIKSFSIEILFLERFIQLAKPGGWIAIIIPDGILTNSNSHYVRKFVSRKARVEAVVSLPRDAFKNVGTLAKTSILFLQKYKEQEKGQENYPVFLASVDSLDEKNFNLVKENYKNFYNKNMSNKNLVQVTTNEKGREIVIVRVDKTLQEIMTSRPNSRWDAGFWLPKYDAVLNEMKRGVKNVDYFGEFIDEIGQGDVPRKNRGEKFVKKGVRFIEVEHIKNTGIYFYDTRFVMENQYSRLKRVELIKDSILLVRSGATIGKVTIVTMVYDRAVVNGHINRILCKKINPYYVTIFLKTKYGQLQLERLQRGVAQPELNFDEISSIEIAVLDKSIQKNIESEYKKMSKYHDKAMEARQKNNEVEYKKNIETAEKILKDLIAKTEAVIRGERKDII